MHAFFLSRMEAFREMILSYPPTFITHFPTMLDFSFTELSSGIIALWNASLLAMQRRGMGGSGLNVLLLSTGCIRLCYLLYKER